MLASTFEELNRTLVLLRRRARVEGAQIAPPPRSRVDFSRIKPVFARFQLADHCPVGSN